MGIGSAIMPLRTLMTFGMRHTLERAEVIARSPIHEVVEHTPSIRAHLTYWLYTRRDVYAVLKLTVASCRLH
jgi:hypothetical protein